MSSSPQDFGTPFIHEDFLPTPQSTTSLLCATCHTPAPGHRCSACKNIHYCTPTCQTSDWPLHKTLCWPYIKSQSARPSPNHRRALYFPTHTARPVFIYLEYGDDATPRDIPRYLGEIPHADTKTLAFHNRFLPHWTQMSYDSNSAGLRFLPENKSIGRAFRGPVVVLSCDAQEGLSVPALDVDTRVLGAVGDYVRLRGSYAGVVFVEQPQERYTAEEWEGIVGAAKKRYSEGEWEKFMGTAGLGE